MKRRHSNFLVLVIALFTCSCNQDAQTGSQKDVANSSTANANNSIVAIADLEKEIEKNFKDSNTHLKLARKYVQRFEKEQKDDNTLGLAFGEYFTSLHYSTTPEVRTELESLYSKYGSLMGTEGTSFATFYESGAMLAAAQIRLTEKVVEVKKDLRQLKEQANNKGTDEDVNVALEAIERNIHLVFQLSTGRKLIFAESGQIGLGRLFYEDWEASIRGYGFQADSFDTGVPHITRIESLDELLRLRSGFARGQNKVVPGLKYLKDKIAGT